jgi:hypothetical protein
VLICVFGTTPGGHPGAQPVARVCLEQIESIMLEPCDDTSVCRTALLPTLKNNVKAAGAILGMRNKFLDGLHQFGSLLRITVGHKKMSATEGLAGWKMHHHKLEHPSKSESLLIRNPCLEEHKLFAGGSANGKG